jgi:hypothetical protein
MEAIPQTSTQLKNQTFQKIAGSHRLEKYGDFAVIDNLVKTYQGTYNHDDIFDLDVQLVENLLMYNKELAYVESGAHEAQRQT